MEDILYLFHHIHHNNDHKVHHCGGVHSEIDQKLNYEIRHCLCQKHSINKEIALGHVINDKLKSVEVKVKFSEKCPEGGWHIESGVSF